MRTWNSAGSDRAGCREQQLTKRLRQAICSHEVVGRLMLGMLLVASCESNRP